MPLRDEQALSARSEIVQALETRGFAVVPASAGDSGASAWAMVERLVGQWPVMLERQPIRAIAGGRSFASSNVFTPFHTDSQDFLGAPPSLQIMICHRPADRGGETLLLDTRSLLEDIEKADPALFSALFTESRRIPFYFGDVDGPTVANKRGHLVFTHSPMAPRDPIGRALAPWIDRARSTEIALRAGEWLIVDNHRMLHGRRAFEGTTRELARVLAWLPGLQDTEPPPRAFRIVAEMIAGTPPGVLAAREGVPEAILYRWRNAVLAPALEAGRALR